MSAWLPYLQLARTARNPPPHTGSPGTAAPEYNALGTGTGGWLAHFPQGLAVGVLINIAF